MSKVVFSNEYANKYRALADKIKSNVAVEGSTIKEVEDHGAYNANLPEGVTPETIKTISKYNAEFTKAAHLAIGETAAELFDSDKNLTKVHGKIGFFAAHDSLNFAVDRSKEYNNSLAKEGEPTKVTKHLVISCDEDIRGSGLKQLRDAMSVEFKDRFAK